jgi:hypothetical protein
MEVAKGIGGQPVVSVDVTKPADGNTPSTHYLVCDVSGYSKEETLFYYC